VDVASALVTSTKSQYVGAKIRESTQVTHTVAVSLFQPVEKPVDGKEISVTANQEYAKIHRKRL